MRNISILISLFFVIGLNAQEQNNDKIEEYTARIIDTRFFQQLDSIVTNVYKLKYKYYMLIVWNKERTSVDHVASKSDSVLYLSIGGRVTPMVYGFGNYRFYETRYRNRTYFIGKGVDNILIRKSAKKVYTLSNQTIKDNMLKDMYSPYLLLEYKNKKLTVEADSRVDDYLNE